MPAPARRAPLVGRAVELAAIDDLVAAAACGRGSALLVLGEAGIGKSRLLGEVAERAVATGLAVLRGRAVPGGGTYRPVAEALARPLRTLPETPRPDLLPLRHLRHAGDGEASAGPTVATVDPAIVLGEAVLALLVEQHGRHGCVLALEDLHWADRDTLALLTYLADAVGEAPVLLALTARDDAASGALAPGPAVTVLRPARLGPDEVVELATLLRGGAPPDAVAHDDLVSRSEGVPLLVEELLDGTGDAGVPPTLAGLVAGRLGALTTNTRAVLVAAAVTPGDPDWALLAAATDSDEIGVLGALRSAADAGLLVAVGDRLCWRHALTREAVLAAVLPPERAAAAGRVADVLDSRDEPGDRPLAAALHLAAGRRRRGTELLLDLARRDAARGALHSADDLLERAASTGALPGPVAAERVRVLTLRGHGEDALAVGTAALEAGTVRADEHAEVCLGLARAAVMSGRWAEAQRWVERAARPDDARSRVLQADAAFGAGARSRAAGLAASAVRAAEQHLAEPNATVTERADRAGTLCEALLVLARTEDGPDLGVPAGLFERAAQVAAEHALTPWRVTALFGLGAVQLSAGDPATPALDEARALAERCGMLAQTAQADVLRADAALVRDGPRRARTIIAPAIERAGRLRMTSLQAMAELVAAVTAALDGDRAEMAALLADAATRPDPPAEVRTLGPAVRAMPHLLGHDLPRAAAGLDEGVGGLLPHGSSAPTNWFGLWVLLRTAVGDRDDEARRVLRSHHSARTAVNRASLRYADAVAAGRLGRGPESAGYLAEGDALLGSMPWWRRLLHTVVLDAAVRDGWGDAVPILRADLAAHLAAGDDALARICRDLLRAAGAPTRTRGDGAALPPRLRRVGITVREADVLALLTEHRTNVDIAAQLHLSPRTVETHVARLLAKTGTPDRTALRNWAAAGGA
jgi:DNA-binding CsgD family transcriptional regulator